MFNLIQLILVKINRSMCPIWCSNSKI